MGATVCKGQTTAPNHSLTGFFGPCDDLHYARQASLSLEHPHGPWLLPCFWNLWGTSVEVGRSICCGNVRHFDVLDHDWRWQRCSYLTHSICAVITESESLRFSQLLYCLLRLNHGPTTFHTKRSALEAVTPLMQHRDRGLILLTCHM